MSDTSVLDSICQLSGVCSGVPPAVETTLVNIGSSKHRFIRVTRGATLPYENASRSIPVLVGLSEWLSATRQARACIEGHSVAGATLPDRNRPSAEFASAAPFERQSSKNTASPPSAKAAPPSFQTTYGNCSSAKVRAGLWVFSLGSN